MMGLWIRRIGGARSKLHHRYLIGVPVILVLFWLVQSLGFSYYAVLLDFVGPGLEDRISAAGAYLLAWSVGFVAIFAPQGIGVQEYALSHFQPGRLSPELAIVVAAGFRLVQMMADVVSWLILRPTLKRWGGGHLD
jgi:hypothetical protein